MKNWIFLITASVPLLLMHCGCVTMSTLRTGVYRHDLGTITVSPGYRVFVRMTLPNDNDHEPREYRGSYYIWNGDKVRLPIRNSEEFLNGLGRVNFFIEPEGIRFIDPISGQHGVFVLEAR